MYVTNTQYRVVVTMAFMHDVNSLLGRLSKHFQNNHVVVSDVTTGIQSAMRSLDRMLIDNGPQLAQFYEDFSKADDHYLGIAFLLFVDFLLLLPPRYLIISNGMGGGISLQVIEKSAKTVASF